LHSSQWRNLRELGFRVLDPQNQRSANIPGDSGIKTITVSSRLCELLQLTSGLGELLKVMNYGFWTICLLAITAGGCSAYAQTYQIGPDTSKPSQHQQNGAQPDLGWGASIENARLARAAQQALQRGDRVQALQYAERAAQAAPNDPQLWFLLGYAARLNAR
jgi:hypothetical protein